MDAQQALADLKEISSQIEVAVLCSRSGELEASTLADEERSRRLATSARALLEAAEDVRPGGGETLTQLEVATLEGSVFVVRDGERMIAATTSVDPTVGLVFYDLKSALRSVAASEQPTRAEEPAPAAEAPPAGEPGAAEEPAPEAAKPKRTRRRPVKPVETDGES